MENGNIVKYKIKFNMEDRSRKIEKKLNILQKMENLYLIMNNLQNDPDWS